MQIFKVGGAVRDFLMGFEPKDIDYVVVGASAEEMVAKGFKQVGADFPVFLSEDGTEYALARTERKSGRGYHGFTVNADASVTLKDDLMRRDLTINAMALDEANDELHDPFGGAADIEQRILRHVSAAFADDPVRVLRLARFHARFGEKWSVAPATKEFCRLLARNDELSHLTKERVWAETVKALSEPEPWLYFMDLKHFEALDVIFPELAVPDIYETMIPSLIALKSRSPMFNYANITMALTEQEVEAVEQRYRVGNDFKNYARVFRAAFGNITMPMMDRLDAIGVFRNRAVWDTIRSDAAPVHRSELDAVIRPIQEAYEAVQHVCFETIPEAVRVTLKGPEITAAIKHQRVFAYETFKKHRS